MADETVVSLMFPCCVQGPGAMNNKVSPDHLSLINRYYEYVFGATKRQGQSKKQGRAGPSELTELQVWITSPDPECEAYPSVTSDESCECLHFPILI